VIICIWRHGGGVGDGLCSKDSATTGYGDNRHGSERVGTKLVLATTDIEVGMGNCLASGELFIRSEWGRHRVVDSR
jgi:hypothetical protein